MNFKEYNFNNKKALVRVDFNVPIDSQGVVTDDTRIRMAIPTINKIINDGGSVILMSHLGRPKDKPSPEFSLKQIVGSLELLLERKIYKSNHTYLSHRYFSIVYFVTTKPFPFFRKMGKFFPSFSL